jgi:F0F1-type ATP synthase membrane subunit c/vacuolar-type H+-ATPase subunit K
VRVKQVIVPTAVGAAIAVAIGALGGGWRNGVTAGASLAALFGAAETLLGAQRDLLRNGGRS